MIVAMIATCSDNSRRSRISSITGRSVHIDLPKLSVTTPTIQSSNCDHQRLVEAEPCALRLDGLLRDAAAVAAQLDLHHVAGNDAQHEEDEHRDAEQRRDREQDAVDGVAEHVMVQPRPGRGPGRGPMSLLAARPRRDPDRDCGSATSSSPSPSCGSARCGATTRAAADRPVRTARFSKARISALRFSGSRSRM